jgi:hypothetical protein
MNTVPVIDQQIGRSKVIETETGHNALGLKVLFPGYDPVVE